MIFIYYLVMKRTVITKNSVMKIQNLVVSHKSQRVKLNPGTSDFLKKQKHKFLFDTL